MPTWCVAGVIGLGLGGCTRSQQPGAPEAAAPPPAAPGVPEPRPEPPPDAASDAADARAGHRTGPPAGGGGGSGVGDIKVLGGLPKGPTESLIRGRSGDLRACYEKARAGNPGLHGKVNFQLTINDRGRVSLAEVVTSTLGGGDPEMCMVESLRGLKFAPPGGAEATITFQMKFAK